MVEWRWIERCALGLVLLTACGDDDGTNDAGSDAAVEDAGTDAGPVVEPLDLPGLGAANEPDPSDTERWQGYLRFLWDTWDTELLDAWPPADFMLALMDDEPEVFGDQYASFGFVPDPNDEFPVGFKRGLADPTRTHETCALCHVGELPDGRLWIGMPAEFDYGAFRVAVNERWVAAGNEPLFTELQLEKTAQLGPGRFHAESSTYPQVVPADYPPYFELGRRGYFNYLGTGRETRSEIYFSIFTFGAGDPNDMEALIPFPPRERTAPLVAFMETIPAPVGPPPEAALAAMGEALFARERCSDCHHPDAPDENVIIPYDPEGIERFPGDEPDWELGSIATSGDHRELIDGEAGPDDRTDLINFILRNRLLVGPSDGYRAQPLAGVWATAPYLHNGSVPTLEDLLRPAAERPATFERSGFTVDVSAPGSSNRGHEFGVDLTDEEREALAAYLRSL